MKKWCLRLMMMLLAAAVIVPTADGAGRRTVATAKKEKQASQKKVKETKQKISDNDKKTRRNLNELNVLKGEISATTSRMGRTQASIDSLNRHLVAAADSMNVLTTRLNKLESTYVKALRRLQGTQYATNSIGFLFSSESFTKGYARIRYMQEFAGWRKRRVRDIRQAAASVESQRQLLATLQTQHKESLDSLASDRRRLETKHKQTDQLVAQLKSDRKALDKALAAEQKRLKAIDNDISRMVAEEAKARKAAANKSSGKSSSKTSGKSSAKSSAKSSGTTGSPTKSNSKANTQVKNVDPDEALTGRFAAAKGSMVFPLEGSYTMVSQYGSNHDSSTGLRTNNTGIEVVSNGSGKVRCVFDGTVSRIFQTREGPYAVMVRHGAYITVYYNIGRLAVKANDKVTAGQTIGTAAADAHYGNKPMLHFEVRNGSSTYNPMQWVR